MYIICLGEFAMNTRLDRIDSRQTQFTNDNLIYGIECKIYIQHISNTIKLIGRRTNDIRRNQRCNKTVNGKSAPRYHKMFKWSLNLFRTAIKIKILIFIGSSYFCRCINNDYSRIKLKRPNFKTSNFNNFLNSQIV